MLQIQARRIPFAAQSNRRGIGIAAALTISAVTLLSGCARQQPVTMAPPVAPMQQVNPGPGMGGGVPGNPGNNVYNWQDVPVGQQVPITNAVFDQGGYQLYAASGETIVVPFVNQNMYVLKFGQTSGGMYFVNDGSAPTLFIPPGGSLANAAAQGARWYPFSPGYQYQRPVYIGLAPTWADYTGMGWYPGMSYYGGYWGWHPGVAFSPMAGLYVNIGGHPYYGWNSYYSYYNRNPVNRVYVSSAPRYSYYSAGRRSPSYGSFGSTRTTGSYRSRSGSFGRSTTGSFGSTSRTGGSFGSSRTSTGSFGSGTRSTFGSSPSGPRGSFGSTGTSSFGGSTRRSSGSFGSGSSGYGGSFGGRSGSFGGGGSSSFGGSRSSFGGGGSFGGSRSSSFGGGSRSSYGGGGSFGGRRR